MPRSGLLALACALLVSACGGEEPAPPTLPNALAERLAARADAVAERLESDDACAARAEAEALHAAAIAAVNERRVPPRFQEELLGSVTALAESIECVPPPPPEEVAETEDGDAGEDDDEGGKKGKKKGKNKKKGKGKD